MIVTGNPLLKRVSGKLKNLVVNSTKGKAVITSIPDISQRKLSQKQKEANEQMQMAIIAAKGVMANPTAKAAGLRNCCRCSPIKVLPLPS